MSPQIPLALKFPADQHFATFHGQAELRGIVEDVSAGRREDWLYLAGAPASGKSHLLLAACAAATQQRQPAFFLSLASVVGRAGDALAGRAMLGLACLDNLDAIAGNADDEVAVFHFHNACRQAGARVIYAASANPAVLPFTLPDLVSRLEQCTRLVLEPLDESGRRTALRLRAGRRGLELDDSVLDYLFRRIGRDLGTLTLLLDRLDRASLAAQRRITVPFLRLILDAPDGPPR